ncbi:MAG: PspA/IM30 family protein, partial [Acidimicrobiales bacterium]
MFKSMKRWWKYLTAKLNSSFEEKADPKVQLEQAIAEAQDQHRRLREQAANVIANQKQTEMRLNRQMTDYEKLAANTKQAVLMADEATKAGDTAKATEYTNAAESFSNRLIQLESEVESLKTLSLQAAQASDQAKAAVQQNSTALQQKLAANTKQAVLMADDATKAGNTDKAAEYGSAAEAFANRLIALEHEIEETKSLALQSTQASEQAKAAVAQNSAALQKKLAERQKLLSQLDQAKMQEQMNKAMSSLSETVGEDVPTLEEVREKIEARYAKATG